MSPRRPESSRSSSSSGTVAVDFTVDDTLGATWDESRLRPLVERIIARHFPSGGEFIISLHLVDDETIRGLNAEHRGKDAHTDVLSFPLQDPNAGPFVIPPGQPANLGDVVVSLPRAEEQAHEYGHSVARELGYLVAHGVLHVLGYDHEEESDRVRMRQLEEEALRPLGFTR
jgi:probable rRNA maturation factor